MAQFNSYIDLLDLTAATDFCREKGTPCHYKKEERFVQQGTVPVMPPLWCPAISK